MSRKKKRRRGATVPVAGQYDEGSSHVSLITPRAGSLTTDSRAPSAVGRGIHIVDRPGQEPKLPRLVPVFPAIGADQGDSPLELVPEDIARRLIHERIGTFVRITKHLSGVRLFPEPPIPKVKDVQVPRARMLKPISHDTLDNPQNCVSYDNVPIWEHYIDLKGRRRRRRVPASTRNYRIDIPALPKPRILKPKAA